jgi:thioredoxin 1
MRLRRQVLLMNKKTLAKIIVPAGMVLVVAGIWASKNMDLPALVKPAATAEPAAAAEASADVVTAHPEAAATAAAKTDAEATASADKNSGAETTAAPIAALEATVASASDPGNNPDFDLDISAVDLEKLTAYGLPLIIDFGADSCIPCREMAPVLKKLNAELRGTAIVKFIDVWKYTSAANNFPIQVIPTQILITADGKPYVPSKDIGVELSMYNFKDSGKHAFTTHQGGLTEEQIRTILADMGSVL